MTLLNTFGQIRWFLRPHKDTAVTAESMNHVDVNASDDGV
jgi:hypothetical protein